LFARQHWVAGEIDRMVYVIGLVMIPKMVSAAKKAGKFEDSCSDVVFDHGVKD
jgi:hypothetical protein